MSHVTPLRGRGLEVGSSIRLSVQLGLPPGIKRRAAPLHQSKTL